MRTFHISHRTRYAYDRPVAFGVHRMMIRPRDAHDMRLLDSRLIVTPDADVRWTFDAFGNSVTHLTFHGEADELVIVSELNLRRYGFDEPIPRIERDAEAYPFTYDRDDSIDLAPFLMLQCTEDRAALERWLSSLVPTQAGGTMEVLDVLGRAIHKHLTYRRREAYGVQTPVETLEAGSGSCRDFAFLFVEAARILGFAARFVTGYLYSTSVDEPDEKAPKGGGSTHAWADVFIPGAGWVEFDPTNRIVASRNLIRVATTRSPAQAVPVSGTYRHDGAVFLGMDVEVAVTLKD